MNYKKTNNTQPEVIIIDWSIISLKYIHVILL